MRSGCQLFSRLGLKVDAVKRMVEVMLSEDGFGPGGVLPK